MVFPGKHGEEIVVSADLAELPDPLTYTPALLPQWRLTCWWLWMKMGLSFLILERTTLHRPLGLTFVFSLALSELLLVTKQEEYTFGINLAPHHSRTAAPGRDNTGTVHSSRSVCSGSLHSTLSWAFMLFESLPKIPSMICVVCIIQHSIVLIHQLGAIKLMF